MKGKFQNVFPINVLLEGPTESQVVADYEALRAISKTCKDNDGHHDQGLIDISELPQAIKNYITANYPDAKITKAKLKKNEYEVYLDNGKEDIRYRW